MGEGGGRDTNKRGLTFPGSLCEGENTISCGQNSNSLTRGSCTWGGRDHLSPQQEYSASSNAIYQLNSFCVAPTYTPSPSSTLTLPTPPYSPPHTHLPTPPHTSLLSSTHSPSHTSLLPSPHTHPGGLIPALVFMRVYTLAQGRCSTRPQAFTTFTY